MTGMRQTRRLASLTLLAVLAHILFASAATASAGAEASFVSKLNAERSQRGLPALSVDGELTQVARGWTEQMIAGGGLSHRPNLRAVVGGDPARVGENVGRSVLTGATEAQLVERIHRAFMDSPGHRHNVLGDWTHVGVGVHVMDDGDAMWVTVNFKATQAPAQPEPARETGAGAGGKDRSATKDPSADKAEPAPSAEPEPAAQRAPEPAPQPAPEPAPTAESEAAVPPEAAPAPEAPAEPDADAGRAAAALRSTARGALSPAIRAQFALNDPPPLPRQLAGYLTAL